MAEKLRAYAYIDSAQLREGLKALSADWRELNLRELADAALQTCDRVWMGDRIELARVLVYDAVAEGGSADTSEVEEWLRRNETLREVTVRRGATLAMDPRKPQRLSQKGVDVQLAVDALTAATRHVFDVFLLVSGDGDFVPLAEAVRAEGPLVCVSSMRGKLSSYLERCADRVGWLPGEPEAYAGWKLPLP